MQSLIEEKTILLVHKNVRRGLYTVTQYSFVGSFLPFAVSGDRKAGFAPAGCVECVPHRMAVPAECVVVGRPRRCADQPAGCE
ncbi:MAG TPA: hypothetical protein VN153_03415 [Tahibacter sp.]|nr:hypothetical protein [Tahibacter sp.]